MKKVRSYKDDWDEYVANYKQYAKLEPRTANQLNTEYPGDEWGRPEEWSAYADKFLRPFLPERGGVAVEIGQGSGKYTLELVKQAELVVCLDVSSKFVKIAKERLDKYVKQEKVHFEILELKNCNEVQNSLSRRGLLEKVDLFCSVDSMVHVELHTLIAYLIAASKVLKNGGHVSMSVASCTNEKGFQRLLDEAPWCYGGMRESLQFYFMSKDMVYYLMEKLGFEIVIFEEDRDINFVARKKTASGITLESVE